MSSSNRTANNGFSGISSVLNTTNISIDNFLPTQLNSVALNAGNNPFVGTSVFGNIAPNYYTTNFTLPSTFFFYDTNNNIISLPTASNVFLIFFNAYLSGFGPAQGTWTAPNIIFGTSALNPVVLNANFNSGNIPFTGTDIPLNFTTGSNQFSGAMQFNHPSVGLAALANIGGTYNILTTGSTTTNFVVQLLTRGASTPSGFGVGTFSVYIVYATLI